MSRKWNPFGMGGSHDFGSENKSSSGSSISFKRENKGKPDIKEIIENALYSANLAVTENQIPPNQYIPLLNDLLLRADIKHPENLAKDLGLSEEQADELRQLNTPL